MNALYCRNCGASVLMQQSAEQFLANFGGKPATKGCAYELLGPVQSKQIV